MTIVPDTRFAWTVRTPLSFDAAVERVTALLAEQGFGILTRIDVHEVLARKLGVQRALRDPRRVQPEARTGLAS